MFEERAGEAALERVVEAFDAGWQVEASQTMASADYLEGLDELPGLRESAVDLVGSEEPAHLACAIEFLLEGLHLCNRLNKSESDGRARYRKA